MNKDDRQFITGLIGNLKTDLQKDIKANGKAIKVNSKDIKANGRAIKANTKAISANGRAIKANTKAINANSEDIKANTKAIKVNSEDIKANTKGIKSNSEEIHYLGVDLEDVKSTIQLVTEGQSCFKEIKEDMKILLKRTEHLDAFYQVVTKHDVEIKELQASR